jgi:hypothetical protein
MMAKNSEFEEEMRKSDTAAYRAGLADEPGTESTAAFMKRTGTKATGQKQRLAVLRSSLKKKAKQPSRLFKRTEEASGFLH